MPNSGDRRDPLIAPASEASDDAKVLSAELSLFTGWLPMKVAREQLRLRQFDLTRRNRQINLKHTAGKTLQFVRASIDPTFRRLTADTSNKVNITALLEPDRGDW
jgi:hypothetical protein